MEEACGEGFEETERAGGWGKHPVALLVVTWSSVALGDEKRAVGFFVRRL